MAAGAFRHARNYGCIVCLPTIGDKSVENIVENRTTSRKSVVRVKF